MRTVLVGMCVLLLAGCETMQQQARPTSADDPTMACLDQLARDDRIAILKPKIGATDRAFAANIEQLASKEKPNDAEKEAIAFWGSRRMECLPLGRSFRAQYAPPGYSEVLEAQQMAAVHLAARLYGGDLTYGQFNVERNEIATRAQAQFAEARRNHLAAVDADAQRQNDAALQIMLQQQRVQQQRRPVNTTCTGYGNTVNCTTR